MLLRNPFRRLQDLSAAPPLQVGTVVSTGTGVVVVELPGGGELAARGTATVGARVFVRGGVVEGAAPALDAVLIDV